MLTANAPAFCTKPCVRVTFSREIDTNAGFNDKEVKEFTVMPCIIPSSLTATIVTPLVQKRSTSRRLSGSGCSTARCWGEVFILAWDCNSKGLKRLCQRKKAYWFRD